LLYLHAAWNLGMAGPIIAVGLLGKILGPIGMVLALGEEFPRRAAMLCVYNDLIWWLPFGLFLVRGSVIARALERSAPWLCVIAHVAAIVMLALVLRGGALTEHDPTVRAAYIVGHPTIWAIGWSAWMIAAASLVGFYAWWGSRLVAGTIATAAVVIAAVGMVCDFSGESLLALVLVERAAVSHDVAAAMGGIERAFVWLSAAIANGLYTVAGVVLTLATSHLPGWVRAGMWFAWLGGAAMSVSATLNSATGLVVSTLVLFPPLLVCIAWMGTRWRPV
jgi:hypothetical protein